MPYRIRVIPKKKRRIVRPNKAMKTPYRTEIIENYLNYAVMKHRPYCNLSARALEGLDAISCSAVYPKGAILFVEGQAPRGVFVIRNGRAKLSANSADGKSLILRIADPGEVVGLPGTISGKPYTLTAAALEPIQADFIARDAFLKFLREHGEVALRVAEILSDIYRAAYQEVRYLGLSGSAAAKLARFLLDLASGHGKVNCQSNVLQSVALTLTHEEIAEMIGSCRETVTRLFSDFKRNQLVEIHGSTMMIRNKAALENTLNS